MKSVKKRAALASVGLVVSATALAGGISVAGASASTPARTQLAGSTTPAAARTSPQGQVPASSPVSFNLMLSLRNASAAQALVRQVSDPSSAKFHHYLTDAQWRATYSPTQAELTSAESWLRQQGFTVGAVPKDRLFVPAEGTAAQVESAFSTSLGYYKVNGRTVRLAQTSLSIPSSIAASVTGAVGVNQYVASPSITTGSAAPSTAPPSAGQEPPPPAGFRNPQPCSAYWGEKIDTTDSAALYKPYAHPLPYDICGYRPTQLRGGYGLNTSVGNGNDGRGVTIAIVDAYASPTLLSDAQHYFKLNDPMYALKSSQFAAVTPSSVDDQALCNGSGWFDEQALDVESSHSMAPGANVLYVGAKDCLDSSLMTALHTAITSGASVVSNSYGDTLGDLLVDQATKTAWDQIFAEAATTGVSVLYSSGDSGDNFADFGLAAPDYPASSPLITSVGGTTLEVGSTGARQAEYGWSTAKQVLCTSMTVTCGSATTPIGALAFNAGGGGGTSYTYTQPYYQAAVVPPALALRNLALVGPTPQRVEPDISMDADAQSGMLIGLTQTFPDGVYYDQFKEGGTSLA